MIIVILETCQVDDKESLRKTSAARSMVFATAFDVHLRFEHHLELQGHSKFKVIGSSSVYFQTKAYIFDPGSEWWRKFLIKTFH